MKPKVFIHLASGLEYLVMDSNVRNTTPAAGQFCKKMVLYSRYSKSVTREEWRVMEHEFFYRAFKEKEDEW